MYDQDNKILLSVFMWRVGLLGSNSFNPGQFSITVKLNLNYPAAWRMWESVLEWKLFWYLAGRIPANQIQWLSLCTTYYTVLPTSMHGARTRYQHVLFAPLEESWNSLKALGEETRQGCCKSVVCLKWTGVYDVLSCCQKCLQLFQTATLEGRVKDCRHREGQDWIIV